MKSLLTISAAGLVVFGFAGEVKLTISGAGMKGVGTAYQALNKDGSKTQRISTRVTSGGRTAEIVDEALCSSTGRPMRRVVKTTVDGKLQQIITVGFGNKDVSVKIQAGGSTRSTSVAYPQGKIEAKSEFWFINSKPAPGGFDEYYRFNVEGLNWEKTKIVYQGPQTIKLNEKDVTGHLVVSDRGKAWLDGKGDPLKMEWGAVKVVRA